jgi:site-specific recombinase XerD
MKISLLLWTNDKSEKKSVKISIYYKENQKYKRKIIDTGVKIEEVYWDKQNKTLSKNHPDYFDLMKKIRDKEEIVKKQLELNNSSIRSLDRVEEFQANRQLVVFLENFIDKKYRQELFGTARKYVTLKNHLIKYQNITGKTLYFNDINYQFLQDFQDYFLNNDFNYSNSNGYKGNFEKLQVLFKEGIKRGYIKENVTNPFNFIKFQPSKSTNDPLSDHDFFRFFIIKNEKIREKVHHHQFQNFIRAKNMFLIQFYAQGIRVSDLLRLKWSNIIDDNFVFIIKKTGKKHSVYLFDEIVEYIRYFLPKPFKKLYSKYFPESDIFGENTKQLNNECRSSTLIDIKEELINFGLGSKKAYLLTSENGLGKEYEGEVDAIRHFIQIINQTKRKDDHIFLNENVNNKLKNLDDYEKIEELYDNERAKYNRHLKTVAEKLDLEQKKLSSHIARHTYSYYFMLTGGDIYMLSRTLHHNSIKVTEEYLERLRIQSTNTANEHLNKKLKNKFEFFVEKNR